MKYLVSILRKMNPAATECARLRVLVAARDAEAPAGARLSPRDFED